MKRLSLSRILSVAACAIIATGLTAYPGHAQVASGYNFANIVSFTGSAGSGANPESGVTLDASGNLYGTTQNGGAGGDGNIWKYNVSTGIESTLASFNGSNGSAPIGGVTFDPGYGNLWGTTYSGGTQGNGTIWAFNGTTLSDVVNFTGINNGAPGSKPYGSISFDASSNLVGTASSGDETGSGGANGFGNVWKYNASTSTFSTPVQFTGNAGPTLGQQPEAGVTIDSSGNYYGTLFTGGGQSQGVIFKYSPSTSTYTALQIFTVSANSFYSPTAPVTIGPDGNLYGTVSGGNGTSSNGGVWKYNLSTNTFSTLFAFTGASGAFAGATPLGGVTFDSSGNLYGTTSAGGAANDGVVWKYNPTTSTYTDLVSFTGATGSAAGATPGYENLLIAANGNIFGTSSAGGANGNGTVFEITSSGATPEPGALALILPIACPATLGFCRRRNSTPITVSRVGDQPMFLKI